MNNKLVFLNDKVAKKLFKNEKVGKQFSARVISDVIGIPYDSIINNLSLSSDEIAFSSHTLNSTADIIYQNDKAYFNIEVNYYNNDSKKRQLESYCYQLYLGQLHAYQNYHNIKKITQISIDAFDIFHHDEFIYTVSLMEEKYHEIISDDIKIVHINLAKLRKLAYTDVVDGNDMLKKDLFFFTCSDTDKIKNIYKGDKLMKDIVDEVNQIAGNEEMNLYLSDEELFKLDQEYERRQGSKETRKQVIANMLKNNLSLDLIYKCVDIPTTEVEKIIKEIEEEK